MNRERFPLTPRDGCGQCSADASSAICGGLFLNARKKACPDSVTRLITAYPSVSLLPSDASINPAAAISSTSWIKSALRTLRKPYGCPSAATRRACTKSRFTLARGSYAAASRRNRARHVRCVLGPAVKNYVRRKRFETSDGDGFADGWQKQFFLRFARGRQGGFMIELDRRKSVVMDPDKF